MDIAKELQNSIKSALKQLVLESFLTEVPAEIAIEVPRESQHGDFSTNIALVLAKQLRRNPREVAQAIVRHLPENNLLKEVAIAGAGFINFTVNLWAWQNTVKAILTDKEVYGCSEYGNQKRIHIEFVSSNPTGPLHVGHGRGAAYGASVANLLTAIGYKVHREYYVNDAGRQMDILATSVWLRYLEKQNIEFVFPSNGYQGGYVTAIADDLSKTYGIRFIKNKVDIFHNVPTDAIYDEQGKVISGDKEAHVDGLIANAKNLLKKDYQLIFQVALQVILKDMRNDLEEFGVYYDEWFSEQYLVASGAVDHCFEFLKERDYLYEKEGAVWFRATHFNDEKDRVIKRANGTYTYFANDIAYHLNKIERGFDHIIDILGADHHGYVPRVKASVQAFTQRSDLLTIVLVQFVSLYRGREKVQMSTRGGTFIPLRELREEVGNSAARFFYVLRKAEQAFDFDLELAKAQSNDNPVYYIQYAHARICSVMQQVEHKNPTFSIGKALEKLSYLQTSEEISLMKTLNHYPNLLLNAASQYAPHLLANYLRELAQAFHHYYNHQEFLVDDDNLCHARLALILSTRQVLANGLKLLGVTPLEKM